MEYKTLANNLKIPSLAYGTAHVTKQDIINAIQVGYRHFDCAQSYGNEREVGEGFKYCFDNNIVNREELFITTKLNAHIPNDYEVAIKAHERSLSDLNIEYSDMYLIHAANMYGDDRWKDKNKELWKAFEYLYEIGKTRSIGISNFMPHNIEELLKTAKIKPMINQIELHPMWQEKELVNYCRENGILLSAWAALAQGQLFDKKEVVDVAKELNKVPSQILLRWSIQKGFIPIAKSSNKERMKENIDIFDFELTNEQMDKLDELNSHPVGRKTPDSFWVVYKSWEAEHTKNIEEEYKVFFNILKKKRLNMVDWRDDTIKYYLFNIAIFTRKKVSENKYRYYLFNKIPFMSKKIKRSLIGKRWIPVDE